jgi:hypothetical protein
VLRDAPPALWPSWLLDALLPAVPAQARTTADPVAFGDRRLDGLIRTVALARPGERNSALYWSARRLAEAVAARRVNREFGAAVLAIAAIRAGLSDKEARLTIASAFKGAGQCGRAQPDG